MLTLSKVTNIHCGKNYNEIKVTKLIVNLYYIHITYIHNLCNNTGLPHPKTTRNSQKYIEVLTISPVVALLESELSKVSGT